MRIKRKYLSQRFCEDRDRSEMEEDYGAGDKNMKFLEQYLPLVPGDRVTVFDYRLFEDDVTTPLSMTMCPATVVRHYGYVSEFLAKEIGREAARYPNCIDIIFDHRPDSVSKAHIAEYVSYLEEE